MSGIKQNQVPALIIVGQQILPGLHSTNGGAKLLDTHNRKDKRRFYRECY